MCQSASNASGFERRLDARLVLSVIATGVYMSSDSGMASEVRTKRAMRPAWPSLGWGMVSQVPVRRPPRMTLPPCSTVSLTCSSALMATFSEMRQPIWVDSSAGSPCLSAEMRATALLVNSSTRLLWMRKRLEAQQTWPVLYMRPHMISSTARSTSPSGSRMKASLPPSSRAAWARWSAAWCAVSMPASVEPVRVMASTSGLVHSQMPTLEPRPVTI